MKKMISMGFQFGLSLFRMIIVGIVSSIFVVYNVDQFTDPSYGTHNLVIIVRSFVFIPIFCVVFVECFMYLMRKKRKAQQEKKQPSYEL